MTLNRKITVFGILVLLGLIALLIYNSKFRSIDTAETWSARETEMNLLEIRLNKIVEEIKAIPSNGVCEDNTDCRVVGLGAKTCEGFRDFLIYSVKDTDESKLLSKVREFNEANSKLVNMALSVPKCGGQPKKPQCVNQHCVVNE